MIPEISQRSAVVLLTALLFTGMLLPPPDAGAVTHCVNVGGTGGCFASVQAAVDAAESGDTISVAAGTYNEQVLITGLRRLRVQGEGAGSTVVEGGALNALGVEDRARVVVTRMTLSTTTGTAAVAAFAANLSLEDCLLVGAPVFNGDALFINDTRARLRRCAVTGAQSDGIQVGSGSTLRVEDSTLTANGRAILNGERALIVNSTISGNGVGVTTLSSGNQSLTRIRSSTIAGNTLGGPDSGLSGGKVSVQSSIVTGTCSSPDRVTSKGYNLFSECVPGGGRVDLDLLGTDPLLGPLQNNGGSTETMLPGPGSPAIDALDNTRLCRQPDQRGAPRTRPCDIGAVDTP